MAVVNTNISASIAQAALIRNERIFPALWSNFPQVKRLILLPITPQVAISTRMTSQIRGLDQAVRNANDGVSMVNTAEAAPDEITDMLQRMRELAVQSGTGTTSSEDRDYLNLEYMELLEEIERVSANTQWNGRNILNGSAGGAGAGSTVAFQVGMDPTQTISLGFGGFGSGQTMASMNGFNLSAATVASAIQAASQVITAADVAIEAVSKQRATFGATSNRLLHAVDNLTNIKTEAEASRSRIMDTDYAAATSE